MTPWFSCARASTPLKANQRIAASIELFDADTLESRKEVRPSRPDQGIYLDYPGRVYFLNPGVDHTSKKSRAQGELYVVDRENSGADRNPGSRHGPRATGMGRGAQDVLPADQSLGDPKAGGSATPPHRCRWDRGLDRSPAPAPGGAAFAGSRALLCALRGRRRSRGPQSQEAEEDAVSQGLPGATVRASRERPFLRPSLRFGLRERRGRRLRKDRGQGQVGPELEESHQARWPRPAHRRWQPVSWSPPGRVTP